MFGYISEIGEIAHRLMKYKMLNIGLAYPDLSRCVPITYITSKSDKTEPW